MSYYAGARGVTEEIVRTYIVRSVLPDGATDSPTPTLHNSTSSLVGIADQFPENTLVRVSCNAAMGGSATGSAGIIYELRLLGGFSTNAIYSTSTNTSSNYIPLGWFKAIASANLLTDVAYEWTPAPTIDCRMIGNGMWTLQLVAPGNGIQPNINQLSYIVAAISVRVGGPEHFVN